jgi:polar amino acid transport system ATP-binding protein
MIEFINASKSFGATQVLKDITVIIKPHQVTAVIGPSGSGKSTLLRTINGL